MKESPLAPAKFWIDLDNTPHVPFFIPIMAELRRRGHQVVVTARDAFQVCELADKKGVAYRKIGRHTGRNKLVKVLGLFYRAAQLLPFVRAERPDLAVSHGARSQVIIANLLRIPTVIIADYEFARALPMMRPQWEIVPEVIGGNHLYVSADRVKHYPGIKEDVYATPFTPDPGLLRELGLRQEETIITMRPPATEAHYHNPEAEILFEHFMKRAVAQPGTRIVMLPRNKRQDEFIRSRWPEWFKDNRTLVPAKAVDGINLIYYSDLVVSGGGTMNREAAALGVPVYSIFRGPTGAVDQYLQRTGRLVMIENVAEVTSKIPIVRRTRDAARLQSVGPALKVIVEHLETILAVSRRG